MDYPDTWHEYRRLVMDHMTKTDKKLEAISNRLSRIESELSELRVKSGVWGAIAGVVATISVILVAIYAKIIQ